MKKGFIILVSLFAMMAASISATAQEITITLLPGWTWIGFTKAETMDISTAFGSFVPMEGDVIKSRYGFAVYVNGQWSGNLQQLTPGLGYHYYSMRGEPVSFVYADSTPQAQVLVTTSEPMLITGNSAMGGGNVASNDGTYILVKGICWATHENPTTNEDYSLEEGSGVGSFSATMTGLNLSTTYYYRAYAVTPSGTVYGDQKTFTTRDGIPTLTTQNIWNITGNSATSGGNITDNCGLNVSARGVCWSTSPNPTVADSHTTDGSGTGSFSSSITGLSVSTTYYVRAYATTAGGTGYGEQKVFTTRNGIPILTTADVTNITGASATCGGYISTNGGLSVTARGVCWSTSPTPTVADTHTTNGTGNGSFSSGITDLNVSTTYYVRAYATTDAGTAYGDEKTFTTRDGIPTLTTVEVTNITGATATCGGDITDNGGLNITARGICWSISPNPTIADSHTADGSGDGSFSSNITGLSLSTTYYVRAYATTAAGTAYGDERTFTTRDGIPILTTADVTNITAISSTCGGTVTDDCGMTVLARGVCWSTTPNPTISDSYTIDASGLGSFNSSITNLSLSTTYYVRAYATTDAGTGYGEEKTFTTRNGIPTVTTSDVTSIGSVWAYSGGAITDDGGLAVVSRGVCWSISPNPTLTDSHTTDGNGNGSFVSCITGLSLSTTYYVRAYATNSNVTVYGNQLSFTTLDEDCVYVDLSLPSGLLWATYNVGANTPYDYGDYFAWGEIQPKSTYNWGTYKYSDGGYYVPSTHGYDDYFYPYITKYCDDSYNGFDYYGYNDGLTILLPEDDAATANWGDNWRMPTKEEWQELYNNTSVTWTTQNGVNGRLFTASNGNSLFLPAAGHRNDSGLNDAGNHGGYWSSSLRTGIPSSAWNFYFNSGNYYMINYERCHGLSVRPVRSASQN